MSFLAAIRETIANRDEIICVSSRPAAVGLPDFFDFSVTDKTIDHIQSDEFVSVR